MTTRTPLNSCLHCGCKFDAVSSPDGADRTPTPGSLSVCLKCGAVAKLGDDLTVEPLTEKEIRDIEADPETIGFLHRLVAGIHFIQEQHRRRN